MDRSKRSEKEEFWRLIMGEQQACGLSARAFCKREGISESLFYGWRRKLAALDRRPPDVDNSPMLLPVAVSTSALATSSDSVGGDQSVSSQVEIQTPGGFRLRVSEAIASNCLGRLLSVVARVDQDQQRVPGAERC
jgi:hypothetical protein